MAGQLPAFRTSKSYLLMARLPRPMPNRTRTFSGPSRAVKVTLASSLELICQPSRCRIFGVARLSTTLPLTTGEVSIYSVYMHRGTEAYPPSLKNFTDIPATFSDLCGGRIIDGLRNDTNPPSFSEGNRRRVQRIQQIRTR